MNEQEEINKLWDAHFEVICTLDEQASAINAFNETLRFIINQMLKQGVNIIQMGKKIPQYELKQIYKDLEEMQGKLEYTFSKQGRLEQQIQKLTPKEKLKEKYY